MAKKLKKAPKPKAARKKPLTLNTALKQIEKMLLTKTVGGPLWDVLSALRGPDCEDPPRGDIKNKYTVPVRRAAFPRLIYATHKCAAGFGPRETKASGLDSNYTRAGGDHFARHITAAVHALRTINRKSNP